MLYREIIAVNSEIHTKHIDTLCGQNVEFLIVKSGGTYSNHWALKGYISTTP
jgi:cysteine sulfinate desulfinase/cysteine desulfurase-like protein